MTGERLGREARELIEQALREEEQVDAAELARIRKRVLTVSVGVGALGSAGKTFAVSGAGSTVGAASIIKAALLGASAAVVAVSLSSVLGMREMSPAPAPAHARERSEPVPREAVVPGAPVERQATLETPPDPATQAVDAERTPGRDGSSLPVARTQAPTPTAAPARESSPALAAQQPSVAPSVAAGSSSLMQEIALLEQVQASLRAGNGARALSLLDREARATGSGQLGAERLAAEVFAACQVGDRKRAARAAHRFLQAYPATPASARVRASCAGEPAAQ